MDQSVHSRVVMFAIPDGTMPECLSGVDYPSSDVRLVLVNASHLKIASAKDLFWALSVKGFIPAGRGRPGLPSSTKAWELR
jgi:hypothetical protein